MHSTRTIGLCGIITVFLTAPLEVAHAGFNELLLRVPADANALVLIDVEKIMSSPLATKEGWKDKYASAYVDMPLELPPDASRLVMAASIDLSSWTPTWEAAAIDVTVPASIVNIAKSEKGHLDTLAGAHAAWTPFNAYFIELAPQVLGVVHPAKRQFAARWIEGGKHRTHPALSHFLHISADPSKMGEIMMAIDLKDLMSPDQLQHELEQSKVVQDQKADIAALTKLFSGVVGVTFHVRIRDKMVGDFAVHFGHDVSSIKSYAKPLLLEFLSRAGASFGDFKNWKLVVSPKGTILSLEGPISDRGLRRLMSIIELPRHQKHPGSRDKHGSPGIVAEATQKHFQAVSGLLEELTDKKGNDTLGHQDMLWFQRYARKIDRLPLLNVDPDVQGYSGQISSLLMQAANALEGTRQAAMAQSATFHPGEANWGYWGTANRPGGNTLGVNNVDYDRRQHWALDDAQEANRQNHLGQQKQVKTEQMAAGTDAARQILSQVESLTNQVRAQMTDRYKINF